MVAASELLQSIEMYLDIVLEEGMDRHRFIHSFETGSLVAWLVVLEVHSAP